MTIDEAIRRASEEVSAMTEEQVRQYLFSILADAYIGTAGMAAVSTRKPPTDEGWVGPISER
jgi:hypothetical protein